MTFVDGPPTGNNSQPFVPKEIQAQLTLIGGTVLDGRPRLRLVWGQSKEASIFWKGRQRLRYLYEWRRELVGYKAIDPLGREPTRFFEPSVELPPFRKGILLEPLYEDVDIGIPRFYIEQLMPAELLCQDWDKLRYDVDGETGKIEDSLGPPPVHGEYQEGFYMIADHSQCCPDNMFRPGCYGSFRAPQQYDVEYVRWLWHQLEQEPYRYSWEEVPPPQVIVQALLDRKTARLNALAKKQETLEYLAKQAVPKGPMVSVPSLEGFALKG